MDEQSYAPPVLANPGNVIKTTVGGGQMGSPLAHTNEALFPEFVPEWFIRSLCPAGGIVADPFSGSGTTVAAALKAGRRGIGFDLRMSQCELGKRRVRESLRPVSKLDSVKAIVPIGGQRSLFMMGEDSAV